MPSEGISYQVWAERDRQYSRILILPKLKNFRHFVVASEAVYTTVYGEQTYAKSPQPTEPEMAKARRGAATELPISNRVWDQAGTAAERVAKMLHEQFGVEVENLPTLNVE